jgi:hypothetical protein
MSVLIASGVQATTEVFFQVSQPMWSKEGGTQISDVTFASAWEVTPTILVELTVAESLVSAGDQFENRNAAHQAGIVIRAIAHEATADTSKVRRPGRFGDTLRVEMDLAMADVTEEIMEATVECMILNAKRSDGKARFLDVRVVGSAHYSHFGGTYNLEPIERPGQAHPARGLRERLLESEK